MDYLFTGFGAAIIGAILLGLKEFAEKYLTKIKRVPLLPVLVYQYLFSIFIFLIPLLSIQQLTFNFKTIIWAFIGSIVLSTGLYLHIKAITIEDFSLTLPFLSFTPLFLIPVEYLFFQKLPSGLALIGIVCIVIGTFYLGMAEAKEKAIKWHLTKGSKLMILVAFIYSIAGNIDKSGSLSSTPLEYLFWSSVFIFLIYSVFYKYHKTGISFSLKKYWLPLLLIAAIVGLGSLFLMNAYLILLVNYAISIKRAAYIIPIILGVIFFKESNLLKRLPGILLMLGGAVIIIIFG